MINPLAWAAGAFWRRWGAAYPTWLLMGGATLLMSLSLTDAGWVENSAPLTGSLVWGLLIGTVLARSRWRGRACLLASQALALSFGLQTIGSILPSWSVLTTRPSVEAVALINARLLVLGERLGGWISALLAGESVRDTGLFILLMGWVAWNASAWLAWAFFRRQQALAGVLPYTALFALNVQLSDQDLWLFAGFLLCALPLAARSHFNLRHGEWGRRRLDYPDELGAEWGAWALLGVAAIAVAARLFVFIATPQGWQALAETFRPLRETVEDTTSRLFADVSPPRYQPTQAATLRPSAQTPALTTLGAPPLQGSLLVMWVRTDGPIPAPPELEERGMVGYSVPVRYWRSEFYSAYTGRGWQVPALEAPSPFIPLLQVEGNILPPQKQETGRGYLTQTYEILAAHGDLLFAANAPDAGSPGLMLRRSTPDGSSVLTGALSAYTVRSQVTQVSEAQLLAAPAVYPPELAAAYLQLPASLPLRVRELAERVTLGAATPYEKALRIQNYLRSTYPYKLDTPLPPPGMDAVDYFLFQAPGGFCSYYASAMAVMLRAVDVPARVAAGYAMGTYDHDRQAYGVIVSDAHAWVEVYFAGLGWVEFEPTAALPAIEYEKGGTPGALPAPPLPPPPVQPAPFPWLALGLGALLLAALGTLLTLTLRKPPAAPSPAGQVQALYRLMRTRLGWARLNAPASATPGEFDTQARESLPPGALPHAVKRITALYEEAVYSPHPPDAAGVARGWLAWRAARREWLAVWVRAVLRRRSS